MSRRSSHNSAVYSLADRRHIGKSSLGFPARLAKVYGNLVSPNNSASENFWLAQLCRSLCCAASQLIVVRRTRRQPHLTPTFSPKKGSSSPSKSNHHPSIFVSKLQHASLCHVGYRSVPDLLTPDPSAVIFFKVELTPVTSAVEGW